MRAIGSENYYEGRGKWRKLASLEQSRLLLQFAKVVPEGREYNRATLDTISQYFMQQVVQRSINGTKNINFYHCYFFLTRCFYNSIYNS